MNKFLPLFLLLTLFSCGVEISDPELLEKNPVEMNLVSTFGNLEEGDILKYRYFYGSDYHSNEDVRCYTNDTLIIEVTKVVSEDELHFKEYLSLGSEIFQVLPDSNYLPVSNFEEREYSWETINDTVKVKNLPQSTGLPTLTSVQVQFPLMEPSTKELSTIGKWQPTPMNGNFCEELEIFGKSYTDLILIENIFELDGPYMYSVYNREYGVVRTFFGLAFSPTVRGWDRIFE